MRRFINLLFLIVGIACMIYYLLMGIFVRFGQSILWLWLVMSAACFARYFIVRKAMKAGRRDPFSRPPLVIIRVIFIICLVFFIAVECVILTGCFETCPAGVDYIIVLGAKVNGTQPSGALYNRITVAYEYMRDNPDTVAIASGGQGPDEGISEAQCIFNGLTERGISAERILMEDMSTNTSENMRFSFALISDTGAKVCIVTNNFHTFRALRIARKLGDFDIYGLPVATSLLSFPHYMLREFCTTVIDTLRGNLAL